MGSSIGLTLTKQNQSWTINSLAPGRTECDYKNWILNLVLLIGIFRYSYDNALKWIPQDLTDDESTLVKVMAWCRGATSPNLSQCWPRSLSTYGVTRPQWVNKPGHRHTYGSHGCNLLEWRLGFCISAHFAMLWPCLCNFEIFKYWKILFGPLTESDIIWLFSGGWLI